MTMNIDDVVITCCNDKCGIAFAVPAWWHRGKRETHTWFYCPNGHQQKFSVESEAEKLRRERDVAKQQLARAEQEAMDALAVAARNEKKVKKLEKRAAAGTCPCCQRTFSNMSNHIRNKHPQFIAENVVQLKKAGA